VGISHFPLEEETDRQSHVAQALKPHAQRTQGAGTVREHESTQGQSDKSDASRARQQRRSKENRTPTLVQKYTNPVVMLAADHRYVKSLFAKCLQGEDSTTRSLLAQEICDNLKVHATLEEELFYPALAEFGGTDGKEFVRKAMQEHQQIKEHMEALMHTDADGGQFATRVEALQARVVGHAEREEAMFPAAEAQLPLGELAARMDMRRIQLVGTVRPPSAVALMALVLLGVGALLFLRTRR
jgi:hypothetical protein